MQDYCETTYGWYSQVLDYSDSTAIYNAIIKMINTPGYYQ